MMTLPQTFHSFEGTPLHCWAAPPISGLPCAKIVLVHGFGTHSESLHFGFLRDHLVRRGFAVYGFDLRGFGRSGGRRAYVHRWQDFRDDLQLFLKAVEGDGLTSPLFVLGVSLGGLIAVDCALHHPEGIRGVIAMSPALDASGVPAWRRTLLRELGHLFPTLALKTGLAETGLTRDQEAQRTFLADPLRQTKMTLRLASQSVAAMADTAQLLPSLNLPLLVLHGSADVIIPPAAGKRLYELAGSADKEFRLFDGAFHILNMEINREEVFDCISAWIAKRLGPKETASLSSGAQQVVESTAYACESYVPLTPPYSLSVRFKAHARREAGGIVNLNKFLHSLVTALWVSALWLV